jgi:DNA-directed RNA polymerase specialized sigma24 family protein
MTAPLPGTRFPDTQPSVVRDATSDDAASVERALSSIARVYWTPIHTYIRLQWRLDPDDAADATQEFFSRALLRQLFQRYDSSRARFRSYVRLCVDSHMANRYVAERRERRGGGADHLALEDAEAAILASSEPSEPDLLFEREWVRAILSVAIETLRLECERDGKGRQFAVFTRYDLDRADDREPPTYGELARVFDLPVTQVTNYLAWARRRFRTLVLDELRAQCRSEEEYREEARILFGFSP